MRTGGGSGASWGSDYWAVNPAFLALYIVCSPSGMIFTFYYQPSFSPVRGGEAPEPRAAVWCGSLS